MGGGEADLPTAKEHGCDDCLSINLNTAQWCKPVWIQYPAAGCPQK